ALTLFDLDDTFHVPSKLNRRIALYAWWWGLVAVNGVLAGALCYVLSDFPTLLDLKPWARAMVVGMGYRALISAKITTIKLDGGSLPVGTEAFYEKIKGFVYRRINRIATESRVAETEDLASTNSLDQLVNRANAILLHDALLTAEQRVETKEWIAR